MSATRSTAIDRWQSFCASMPVAEKWAYFDHAAVAPMPAPAAAAVARWAEQSAREGDTVWPEWSRGVEQTRASLVRLLNADESEIALVHSTTEGITLVAEGYPWCAGDNVVTLANEFPSNQYPWLNLESRGVETRRVPPREGRVDLAALESACDERTKIVSVSWVGFATGWRVDLNEVAELVHRRGALLFVDAIQGLGAFPLDVKQTPIDFLAADGHKWMLGPEGAGVFYLRREHLDLLRPIGVGWHSVVHASDYNRIEMTLKPSAARYEGGTQNMAGFLAWGESLKLLLDNNVADIGQRILEITDLACERLSAAGATIVSPRAGNHRSGVVLFEVPGSTAASVRERCLTAGVALAARGGKLRISPHAYVNEADVDRLVEAIRG